ncbi:MAG TPA: OmpH family outer membrane protein [Candidatus Sulfopaludibacter sp.]|nr:OmpH family outer membrane protein [Candidatus Sulfopaludibacter sp.]
MFGVAALAFAQTQPTGAVGTTGAKPANASAEVPTKIAILYVQNAMLSCAEGKKAAAELQGRFSPRRATLEKRQTDIQAMQDQLKKGSSTMSDDAKNKLTRQIETDGKNLQRDADDLNSDAEQEQNKVFQDLWGKLNAIVTQYATQNGYSIVLDVSNQQGPILWAAASTDITSDIVKLYDQAHPVTAAPAPAPPPAKK